MSNTENLPEFDETMANQELAASFDYQEKEALLNQLTEKKAKYGEALMAFSEANKVFQNAVKAFEEAVDALNEAKKEYENHS